MKEYKMICSKHVPELSTRATDLLNEGWELYGSPMVPSYSVDDGFASFAYAQAFVRGDKEEKYVYAVSSVGKGSMKIFSNEEDANRFCEELISRGSSVSYQTMEVE